MILQADGDWSKNKKDNIALQSNRSKMLHSSRGFLLGVLLFTSIFQSQKPAKLENKSIMCRPFLLS